MKRVASGLVFLISFYAVNAQRVIYSEPDRNDYRQTEFEIIGKIGGNILVYKNLRSSMLSVFMIWI